MKFVAFLMLAHGLDSKFVALFQERLLELEQTTGLGCEGHIFNIPSNSEPSDVAVLPDGTVAAVSDNGLLIVFSPDGVVLNSFAIEGEPDLEGLAVVPSRPRSVYLAQEMPPTIIEFSFARAEVVAKLDLSNVVPMATKDGIESLLYVPGPVESHPGYFVVGRQHDALLFVFEFNHDLNAIAAALASNKNSLHILAAPGPTVDLSALTLWKSRVWFLYDKPKTLNAIHLTDFYAAIAQESTLGLQNLASDDTIGQFSFDIRGQEGIAFSADYVLVAVDAPHKTGRKDLISYSIPQFFQCFSAYGTRGIPN